MAALAEFSLDEDEIPPEWTVLDDSLRCDLCASYYQAAVMIAVPECLHTFCAECLLIRFRKEMEGTTRKKTCPLCRCEVKSDSSIVMNRKAQEMVVAYLDALSARRQQGASKEKKKKKRPSPMATPSPAARPIRTTRQQQPNYEENDADEEAAATSATATKAPEEATKAPEEASKPLKHRPAISYHQKNQKQLKQLCEEDGILSSGTKEILVERHRNFIILWNAECYSIMPRTPKQLAEFFNARERKKEQTKMFARKEQSDSNALKAYLEPEGHAGSRDKNFEKGLFSGFRALIAQGRANMPAKEKENNAASGHDDKTTTGTICDSNTENLGLEGDGEIGASTVDVDQAEREFSQPVCTEKEGGNCSTDGDAIIDESAVAGLSGPHPVSTDETVLVVDEEDEEHGSENSQPCTTTNGRGDGSVPPSNIEKKRPRETDVTFSFQPKRERRSILSAWHCVNCTFLNEKRKYKSAKCEMCDAKRPEVV